ncbi:MAG: ribonuclease HII [Clostridia bacterium]|nr:ribonuclease HII [Clostridia bacterium]MBQ6042876.1 ribonuclease HII [Clostridia bacterium]MBQ6183074.1 ribonuclease HII [Clostridia bacterium]
MLDWEIEKKYYSEGAGLICGCDEAGRGPLAGPVFAAAVILPVGLVIEGLDDSKRIKPEKREELYKVIRENALDFAVAHAEVYEIEAINILNASMLAMRRAIAGLRKTPDLALIDGNIVRDFNIRAVPVVKGDARSPSIAAASILAKVERDRFCEEMDKFYPGYNFTKNKGYATKQHKAAILKNGPAPVHRRSFLRKTLGDAIEQFDIWQSW